MSLSQNYNPQQNEKNIYQKWQDFQIGNPNFQKNINSKKTHSILMPPPNLTGDMHAGHAFGHYAMDTLSRIARQKGQKDLWFPGVDHAGLQLEGVIDKLIRKGEFDDIIRKNSSKITHSSDQPIYAGGIPQTNRFELQKEQDLSEQLKKFLDSKDKEDFPQFIKSYSKELWLELAWSKVNQWRDNQKNQASVLGDTPDYSRSLFTLDEKNIEMVNYAFQKYWKDGLIYKGSYLVNWSVGLQTALSDVAGEIEYEKRIDPFATFEFGVKRFEYQNPKLISKYSPLKIKPCSSWKRPKLSTVRPETKFTDIAVAMHPSKFEIYFGHSLFEDNNIELQNQFLDDLLNEKIKVYYELPPLHNRELVLVFTEKVDPNFGTGIMKITPTHDQFDYDLCKELIAEGKLNHFRSDACIGRDGKLNREFCGEFSGTIAHQARGVIFKRLIETGYIPLKTSGIIDVVESENFSDKDFWAMPQENQYNFLKAKYPNHAIDWNYEHNVTICERTRTIVEPLISEEFFLSYHNKFDWKPISKDDNISIANNSKKTNLQELGLEAVQKTNFFSEGYKERGINFLNNIKDWCISRDLIWGHKMPVWYNLNTNPNRIFYSDQEMQKDQSLSEQFRIQTTKPDAIDAKCNWVQEVKILDTWFSSCLWPLSTLDYTKMVKNKNSKTNIVLIHGGEAWSSREEYIDKIQNGELNSYWYSSFFDDAVHGSRSISSWKKTLADHCQTNNISLIRPKMPNKTNADYLKWKLVFEKTLPFVNENTILIGHSLGSMFLTKYLSENPVDVGSVFLVSGGLATKFGNSPKSFDCPENIQNLFAMGNKVNIIHSEDDNIVPCQDSYELHRLLPNSNLVITNNQGHLNTPSPELIELIISKVKYTELVTDFEVFYPTQELLTAKEIFYQWIIRMTTLSYYFSAQIPYTDLIITPTVLDDKGKKMSKSLGNGLEPVSQINKYSSDSLRMAMLGGMIPNRNMKMGGRLADELCEKYRNFGNKMWNVARFFEYQDEKFASKKTEM